jgi:hypothetical protein
LAHSVREFGNYLLIMSRSQLLLSLRSEIPLDAARSSLEIEQFQNACLRPILKFQNDALLLFFKLHLSPTGLPLLKKELEDFIKLRLQKDAILRNTMIGMVLALMSVEELSFYMSHKNELSKRIITILVQRLTGQLIS